MERSITCHSMDLSPWADPLPQRPATAPAPERSLPRCAVVSFRREGDSVRWLPAARANAGRLGAHVRSFDDAFELEEFSALSLALAPALTPAPTPAQRQAQLAGLLAAFAAAHAPQVEAQARVTSRSASTPRLPWRRRNTPPSAPATTAPISPSSVNTITPLATPSGHGYAWQAFEDIEQPTAQGGLLARLASKRATRGNNRAPKRRWTFTRLWRRRRPQPQTQQALADEAVLRFLTDSGVLVQ